MKIQNIKPDEIIANDCPIQEAQVDVHPLDTSSTHIRQLNQIKNQTRINQVRRIKQTMSQISQEGRKRVVKKKIPSQIRLAIKNQAQRGDGAQSQLKQHKKQKSLSSNKLKETQQFLCQICQRRFDVSLKEKLCYCNHSFCNQCLNHYVSYKIRMFEQISCPDQFCESLVNQNSSFYKSLPQQIRKKYNKNSQFYQCLKNPNLRLCPRQKCDGVLKISTQKTSKCDRCKRRFCSKCFLNPHQGGCQIHEIQFFQNNFNYRQCSTCKMMVQKISGCNHITCICGNQFCYNCGQKWQVNHRCNFNHYNNYFQSNQIQRVPPIQNNGLPQRGCLCCDRICGPTIADICKWPLKFFLFLINLLLTFMLFQTAFFMTPMVLMVILIGGLVAGPFIFLNRLWNEGRILLMVTMIILQPLSIIMGIKISLVQWFWQVLKYQCGIISDFFLSFCGWIRSF